MGRTYRRNPDDYYSYGNKSLREKRQRGSTRSNWDSFDSKGGKKKPKWEQTDGNSNYYYTENYDD